VRFLIVGSGAVGGYFGAKLARAGADVVFLARGAHLAAMRDRGLEVKSVRGDFTIPVKATDRATEPADVAIVAVKAYDTRTALEPCRPLLGFALTLQNGLGSIETLSGIVGREKATGGVAYVGGELVAPGRIVHETGGRLVIGEPSGPSTARMAALKDVLEKADVPCEVTENLAQAIWEKLVANAVFNVIAAAWRIELGDILTRRMRPLAERAIEELVAVAAAEGVEVREQAVEHCWKFCETYPEFKTSTQQDVARGKPTEWEVLSAELIRRGERLGVATPTHTIMLEKLRATISASQSRA
jgi:2-dehydropantoate 2-reductase